VALFGSRDEILDFAEVNLADDLGLTVDALAKAGIVIGVTVDLLRSKTRHM
jgi:hypothetical protein